MSIVELKHRLQDDVQRMRAKVEAMKQAGAQPVPSSGDTGGLTSDDKRLFAAISAWKIAMHGLLAEVREAHKTFDEKIQRDVLVDKAKSITASGAHWSRFNERQKVLKSLRDHEAKRTGIRSMWK